MLDIAMEVRYLLAQCCLSKATSNPMQVPGVCCPHETPLYSMISSIHYIEKLASLITYRSAKTTIRCVYMCCFQSILMSKKHWR